MARKAKEKYKNDVSELKVGDVYYSVEVQNDKKTFGPFNINPVIGRKVVIADIGPDVENPMMIRIAFRDEDGKFCYAGTFKSDEPNWHLEVMQGFDLYSSPEQAMFVMRPKAAQPVEEAYNDLLNMQVDIARSLAKASVEFGLISPEFLKKK